MAGTQPARGTRDFLPDDIRRREYVVRIVREVYERYGFEPLETPAFENIDTLLGKYGEEGNKLIFKILRRGEHEGTGEADLALRYDLTVPLARVVAQYQNELPRFFRRYQIQPVWRADRPARGRFREFYQCDIDAIGTTSLTVEAELLAAVADVLGRLAFEDFTIRLNDRRVLTALLTSFGIPPEQHADTLVGIDKLDKIGTDGVRGELVARGVGEGAVSACIKFFQDFPLRRDARSQALTALTTQMGADAVTPLAELVALADRTSAGPHILIDPSLARGLSYYTGAIMEIAVPDLAGSLGGGGRYDNLIGMFLGRDIPACGFSLGLERIIVVMTERHMFPARVSRSPVDVMVVFLADDLRADALALAAELRTQQLRVDVYPEVARKLDKPLKYAGSRLVPVMAILGADERARGEVTVRDLQTRRQESPLRTQAATRIGEIVRLVPTSTDLSFFE
ncbi:MAG: histidine--tRNA ligase [Vicinamibacterales bacterium]